MSGQTISDRLTAAKHSISGQGLAKAVCKATTEEVMGPKKKHLDYLIQCTHEPNVSIPQLANLLIERAQNSNWVIVFKSLVTLHNLMNYGNERFTQFLASNNCTLNLSNFIDKTGVQGYDMSTYIRRYAKYINEKAYSYRSMAFDFCKVKRGKQDGLLRTMNAEKLLKTIPPLQHQLDVLVEFDVSANELTNGVVNAAFMLLFKDLIRLFACYNDGIINLLEKYFDMQKKQCREALEIYRRFLARMERCAEFLKVAESVGIDKGDIPDLAKAPSSLLEALEEHLKALEGQKKSKTAEKQGATAVAAGITQLQSPTSPSGAGLSDEEKRRIIDEENKELEKLKTTSPTAEERKISEHKVASPVVAASKPVVAEAAPASVKASDDLLGLGFNDSASAGFNAAAPAGPGAAVNNPFGGPAPMSQPAMAATNSWSAPPPAKAAAAASDAPKASQPSPSHMLNGNSSKAQTNTFISDANFAAAFGDNSATPSQGGMGLFDLTAVNGMASAPSAMPPSNSFSDFQLDPLEPKLDESKANMDPFDPCHFGGEAARVSDESQLAAPADFGGDDDFSQIRDFNEAKPDKEVAPSEAPEVNLLDSEPPQVAAQQSLSPAKSPVRCPTPQEIVAQALAGESAAGTESTATEIPRVVTPAPESGPEKPASEPSSGQELLDVLGSENVAPPAETAGLDMSRVSVPPRAPSPGLGGLEGLDFTLSAGPPVSDLPSPMAPSVMGPSPLPAIQPIPQQAFAAQPVINLDDLDALAAAPAPSRPQPPVQSLTSPVRQPSFGLESLTIETFQAMGGKSPKSLTPVKTAGGGVKPPPLMAVKTGPATGPAVVTPPVTSAGFDSFGAILQPQNTAAPAQNNVQPTSTAVAPKLIQNDIDSSLASLAGNLTVGAGQIKTQQQWNKPTEKRLTGGTHWQNPSMASATMAPMNQPMGMYSGPMQPAPQQYYPVAPSHGYTNGQPLGYGNVPSQPIGMQPMGMGMQPMGAMYSGPPAMGAQPMYGQPRPPMQQQQQQQNPQDPFGAL